MSSPQNPVGWFELYVQDMDRAKRFYETLTGAPLTPLPGFLDMQMFAMDPEKPGCGGALVKAPGVASGHGGTMVYFSCADCGASAAVAAGAGGKVFKEKFSIGDYGFIALVHDTEGNLIGLHSQA
jgi:uncharacterized protein